MCLLAIYIFGFLHFPRSIFQSYQDDTVTFFREMIIKNCIWHLLVKK